ncbi:hypothetical protein, partial [Terriglobus sp. ADX1]|uniref:hypothetical protein n=1 Tax=Terriglobus sp. ADX1 TaxID=2794063 RepID=UPI002FE6251D
INVTDMKPDAPASSYIAVLMKPQAYFSAWSPKYRFAIAYVWDAQTSRGLASGRRTAAAVMRRGRTPV